MHIHYGKCYKGNVHSTMKLNRKKCLINTGAQGITFMMRQMVKMDKLNEGWKRRKVPGRGSCMCKFLIQEGIWMFKELEEGLCGRGTRNEASEGGTSQIIQDLS